MPVESRQRPRGDPQCHPYALQPEGADRAKANGSTRSRRSTACQAPDHRHHRASASSILTRNSSPDIGFDRSINAYRGCEHGCIYCFARPTHAYHDLSPGVDFESRLFVKPNAAQLLHAALSRPGYECRPIAMGTNTDPYQPIEERWRITRSLDRAAAGDPPPVHHHHQVGPRASRSRSAQAGGGPAPCLGRAFR